ncbi:MAG: YihY family inner membrane protein [Ramlibacter sp.]|jgi:membrane protein|nr:YihY family inner membrane protein [Ramlibacter sp.]
MKLDDALQALKTFPWRATGATLLERFREDRLGNTASSLTFTTVISMVPLFAVILAVFSAFPMFGKLQGTLQQWLAESLIPEAIAKQVMGYLTQFATKASRLGLVGVGFLLVTAISLILTIDRTLNAIWRVRRPRPLAQRVLMYWAVLTLGPLLLAASLAMTSYALSASRGVVSAMPGSVKALLNVIEFAMMSAGVAALYHYVPNTLVKWRHALAGGVFVAVGLELAKAGLAAYLKAVPTYSAIYGAFASVPILLLWIYVVWVVLLLGAVIAAYLPSLLGGVARRGGYAGWQFQLGVEVLQALHAARQQGQAGTDMALLARQLHVDTLELEPVVESMAAIDWVGRLEDGRLVLLADAEQAPLSALAQRLLLAPSESTDFIWKNGLQPASRLAEALQKR